MKRKLNLLFLLLLLPLLTGIVSSCGSKYKYEKVSGDPLNARIYTLDNGLKVYMSVYKDEPRIQAFVTVRVGSKNDPAETTGLAHYFEHLMFKGTSKFGSLDWEKEKPLLDEIEALFEKYRNETDPEIRKSIYKVIDSVSFEASKLAIPNEYDKLMSAIGSNGTNAFTSNDVTAYTENIPSNQLENWALIQSERFVDPVIRLFHTELETVYEEKNMYSAQDAGKVWETLFKLLYPNHPYGQQTTIGEAEHLKNPSIVNIKNFFDKYYVPNNMAVVLAGDFDPDKAIVLIDKYFGKLEPKELPEFTFEPEKPIQEPVVGEVIGLEAEQVNIAFRFPGASSREALMGDLLGMMLSNRRAGLLDLNVNLKQRTLSSYAGMMKMADYSALNLIGRNKSGQSLEEVKDILLEQVDLLKKGEFPDWMLEATINNLKLNEMRRLESNRGRVYMMHSSFVNKMDWKDAIGYIDELGKVTKEELVAFANENLGNNYVVVYKRQGEPEVELVEKPAITPIHINRDAESDFIVAIKESKVPEIEPVFLDFEKDITKLNTANNLDVLYSKNDENSTFMLYYYFPFGSDNDKMLNLSARYLEYLGTSEYTAEEIKQEFYKLACSFSVYSAREETYISVSGLSENQEAAVKLLESLLTDCQPNDMALTSYVQNVLRARENAKQDQRTVFRGLADYANYGEKSPFTNEVPAKELNSLKAETLVQKIKELTSYPHKVLYYGTLAPKDLVSMVESVHNVPEVLKEIPEATKFIEKETTSNRVVFSHYDASQSTLQLINKGVDYNFDLLPAVYMYNNYFGTGMSAIVFQELREKRGLAYTAWSRYLVPSNPDKTFMNFGYIGTQNDKVVEAFNAFNDLYNNIPTSETTFTLAKESIINGIRNERITKMNVIWDFLEAEKMGFKTDVRKTYFETIPTMTLDDVVKFNHEYVKDQPKTYVILGNEKVVNFKEIEKQFGPIEKVSRDKIFNF